MKYPNVMGGPVPFVLLDASPEPGTSITTCDEVISLIAGLSSLSTANSAVHYIEVISFPPFLI